MSIIETIKSSNPLQEKFTKSNNELFPEVMKLLLSDMEYIEKKFGKNNNNYRTKMNMFSALSKYQLDTMNYIKCLEHEVVNQSMKTHIMSSGYRKVADMKVNEIAKLTKEEIAEISTIRE